MFGLKKKRTREEQKVYEEKVYNTVRNHTIFYTERIFRFTRIDRGIRHLQLFTKNHRRGTLAVLGGAMTAILVYYISFGNLPNPGGGRLVGDSIVRQVTELPSYYSDVFRTNRPQDFVERVVHELKIDTLRYRTDSLYKLEINRQFLLRYGRFNSAALAFEDSAINHADSLELRNDSLVSGCTGNKKE